VSKGIQSVSIEVLLQHHRYFSDDLVICAKGIDIPPDPDGLPIQERIGSNRQMLEIINKELARRGEAPGKKEGTKP
jgi:hypothetical protein